MLAAAVAASADAARTVDAPSVPIAGVSESKRSSSATVAIVVVDEPGSRAHRNLASMVSRHERMASSIS